MFNKKRKYIEIPVSRQAVSPAKSAVSTEVCPVCETPLAGEASWAELRVCPHCNHRETLGAWERIDQIADPDSFTEINADLVGQDWLQFPEYKEKLELVRRKTGLKEAMITGTCSIDRTRAMLAVMDSRFMMASMGTAVGEKLVRAIHLAIEQRLPLVIFAASGGARMQEGIFALLQMSRTSAAMGELNAAGLFSVVVLTDPTTGGVMASFASLADVIIAEKGALIGFAGPRVITQTTGEKLPDGFQRAETQLKQGMIDLVLEREEIRANLSWLLKVHREEDRGQ